ncbi:MAG: PAS domain S-box protein [Thiohalophilus sp.]
MPLHCSAAAELSFTLYIDVYSLPIFSGHIIKLLSYWLIFLAVVHTSLSEPYQILTRASSTYDAVPDPTIVVDNAGRITQVNKAAEDLAGLSREDLLEKDCHEVFHPRDMEKALCVVCNSIKSARTIKNVELAFPENGRYYDVTLTPFEYQQDIKGMVHVLHDVTEKKQTEQKLIHNAHYDPLTDFPNRMLAADRLEQAIGHARRFNRHTAVLFIDLDNFKRSASGFCVRFVVIYILWIKTVLLMNASPSIFPRVRSGVRNLFGN